MFESELLSFYRKHTRFLSIGAKAVYIMPDRFEIRIKYSANKKEEQNVILVPRPAQSDFKEYNAFLQELFSVVHGDTESRKYPVYLATCKVCNSHPLEIFDTAKSHSYVCHDCFSSDIDRAMSEPFKGDVTYVYLISNESKTRLKIGFSSNPTKRIKQLNTGNPDTLRISGLIRGGLKLEKQIHKMFSDYRINLEWFEYKQEILDFFAEKSANLHWEYVNG